MKKVVFTLILLVAMIGLNAQTVPSNPNGPEIKFDKTVHNYGEIMQGANGDCEFSFTNTGKEPLILSNVAASCGCTTPNWTREPIMPGKKGTIKVHYDTNRLGIISKTITVVSNGKTDRVVLRIEGKVNQKPAENVPQNNVNPNAVPTNNR